MATDDLEVEIRAEDVVGLEDERVDEGLDGEEGWEVGICERVEEVLVGGWGGGGAEEETELVNERVNEELEEDGTGLGEEVVAGLVEDKRVNEELDGGGGGGGTDEGVVTELDVKRVNELIVAVDLAEDESVDEVLD